jgi:hypothetical protein
MYSSREDRRVPDLTCPLPSSQVVPESPLPPPRETAPDDVPRSGPGRRQHSSPLSFFF